MEGLVQSVYPADFRDVFLVRELARQGFRRVARHEADGEEDDEGDAQQDGDEEDQPPQEIFEHTRAPSRPKEPNHDERGFDAIITGAGFTIRSAFPGLVEKPDFEIRRIEPPGEENP